MNERSDNGVPRGELSIQTVAMPADTNAKGYIFGGWLLSEMDIAGGIAGRARADERTATMAIESMVFHKLVYVGDVLRVYTDLERIGPTSLAFRIEAWVQRMGQGSQIRGTNGVFTYVAIGEDGRLRAIEDGRIT